MARSAPPTSSPAVTDVGVDRAVLRALVRLASLVTGSHDALKTIEAVAETARELLGAASLSISSCDDDGTTLTTVVNVGMLAPSEVRWPTDEKYDLARYPRTAEVLRTGRHRVTLAHVDDPDSDPAEVALLRSLGKAGCLNAPVVVDGVLWGELWASRTADQVPFDAYVSELSEVVVGLIAAGLVQAAAWQQLRLLASTDPLTGLANRREFDQRLDGLLDGPVLPPGFALVLGDVNGLKQVNDTLGHPAGDRALCDVAERAQAAVAAVPGALAARLGGDEYALLLPGLGVEAAVAVAAAWGGSCDDQPRGMSLATGVVVVREGVHLAEAVFGGADRAMYRAKKGRSRVPVVAAA